MKEKTRSYFMHEVYHRSLLPIPSRSHLFPRKSVREFSFENFTDVFFLFEGRPAMGTN